MSRRLSVYCVWIALLLLAALPASALYNVSDLGTLYPDTAHPGQYLGSSYAYGINNYSQIVGQADPPPVYPATTSVGRAFLYTGGAMVDLGTLYPDPSNPGQYLGGSVAYGINDYGQVVGTSSAPSGYAHAFLWTPTIPRGTTGSMIDLGTFYADNITGTSVAFAIDSIGQVTGYAERPVNAKKASVVSNAYLWTPTTNNGASGSKQNITPLTLYSAVGYTITPNVNAAGTQITGHVTNGNINVSVRVDSDPFSWTPSGGWSSLDPGASPDPDHVPYTGTCAYGINDARIAVGIWSDVADPDYAVIWQNGSHFGIPGLPGYTYAATARAINNVQTYSVVGDASDGGTTHGFLYNSGVTDLNTLISPTSGWVLNTARGVNNNVEIVGYGVVNSQTHAYWLH